MVKIVIISVQKLMQQIVESVRLSEDELQVQHVLYNTPPSLQNCYRHRRANVIFKNIEAQVLQQPLVFNYCECCGRVVGKEPKLRFLYDPIEAAYLGPGIPLFFAFFRCVLYLLLVCLLIFGVFTTMTNLNGNYCETKCGTPNFWNTISVFNIFDEPNVLKVQMYFELAIIIITIFVNVSIRSYLNYMQIYIDEFFATPSDYSIMIRKIPENAQRHDIEKMVIERLQALTKKQRERTENLKISEVLMIRDLKQFLEVQERNLNIIKQHIKKMEKDSSLQQMYLHNDVIPDKFAKTAIVVFSSAFSKYYFLDQTNIKQRLIRTLWGSYYPRSNVHKIKDQFVSIYRAPEPDDLVWQNCGIQTNELLKRRVGLYLLSFFVLAVGGAVQYLISFVRNLYIEPEDVVNQFLFSLGAATVVAVFNFLIGKIFEFMAENQGHDTKTQLRVAMTFRIVFFQFLNTGIFVVLSNIFVKITTDEHVYDFRKAVLSFNILQVMLFNAVNGNFTTFFLNYFEVFNVIQRYQIRNKKKLYTQIEANDLFAHPNINIHFKYAYIFKTYWTTIFFMPTVPSVIAISAIGLTVNYWIQKYLFSGVYSAPEAISSYLSTHVLNLLDYSPLWLTLGSIFVHVIRSDFRYSQIPDSIKVFHYIFLALSILNIFLPYHAILKRFNKYREPNPNQTSYQQALSTFEITYEDTNPIYVRQHRKRIREEEVYKQKITKDAGFQEMKMKMSQSQIVHSHKESLLNKSILTTSFNLFRHRASSVNF